MQTLGARRGGRKPSERSQEMDRRRRYPGWVRISIWVAGFVAPWIIILAIWSWR